MKRVTDYQFQFLAASFAHLHDSWWHEFLLANYATLLQRIDTAHNQYLKLDGGHDLQVAQTQQKAANSCEIYPIARDIFKALNLTSLNSVKVVILGQDPYHGEGQANGLAFAISSACSQIPPSLKNILKELLFEANSGLLAPLSKTSTASLKPQLLLDWPKQGVLLLNSSLTVMKGRANSLAHIGWQDITDGIIHAVSHYTKNTVFLLWGAYANSKQPLIHKNKHLILSAPHPSPLSAYRGFLGCQHFMLANAYLNHHQRGAIDWLGSLQGSLIKNF